MKITNKQIKKAKSNPELDGIPDDLKTTERFDEVEKELGKMMISDHTHAKAKKPMESFLNCKRCFAKLLKKRARIQELGFKDYEQYMSWRKVMRKIKGQDNFVLYGRGEEN